MGEPLDPIADTGDGAQSADDTVANIHTEGLRNVIFFFGRQVKTVEHIHTVNNRRRICGPASQARGKGDTFLYVYTQSACNTVTIHENSSGPGRDVFTAHYGKLIDPNTRAVHQQQLHPVVNLSLGIDEPDQVITPIGAPGQYVEAQVYFCISIENCISHRHDY
jgi:hypothetical protein